MRAKRKAAARRALAKGKDSAKGKGKDSAKGKGSAKADIARKFIQYMLSPDGQVHSARMAAYPGFTVTKGGPGYATTPFDLMIYRKAFESGELGYASALSVILFCIVLVISAAQLRMFDRLTTDA